LIVTFGNSAALASFQAPCLRDYGATCCTPRAAENFVNHLVKNTNKNILDLHLYDVT